MAIEFQCPYCTAVMRVPDEFATQQGRCPKCDTVVIVPDVRPPQQPKSPGAVPDSEQPTQVRPPAAPAPSEVEAAGIPDLVTTAAPPVLRKRRRKRGRQRVWMVGIPVICFLLLLGAIGWYTVNRLPTLSGQLTASVMQNDQLPPTLISWSAASGFDEDQLQIIRSELEVKPEAFVSSQLVCRMLAVDDGLQVTLRATSETAWYVVNPAGHAALVLWLRKHRDRLNSERKQRFQTEFQDYCSAKLRVISGQSPLVDAQRYRNSVGLDGSCSGFGSVVEAVVQNRVVRCAREDEAGKLYFCLPRGITAFQLQGKTFADGQQPFGGQFQVKVVGSIPIDDSDPEEGLPSEGESEDAPAVSPDSPSDRAEPGEPTKMEDSDECFVTGKSSG